MKNIFCMRLVVLFVAIGVLVVAAAVQAEVIFGDTFETKTAGVAMASVPPYDYPEIKTNSDTRWVNQSYRPTEEPIYEAGSGVGGSMGLKVFRDPNKADPISLPNFFAHTAGDESCIHADGDDFGFALDWKAPSGATWNGGCGMLLFGSTSKIGGFMINAGTYRYWTGAAWVDTGIAVVWNAWNRVEMIVTPGPIITGTMFKPTYDLYVTPEGGTRTLLVANVATTISLNDATMTNNARLSFAAAGPAGLCYYDNVSVQSNVPPPLCGDENHPYLEWDLNKDCIVNFADFAMLAANWLTSY